MSTSVYAKFRAILLLISFVFVGVMLWRLYEANRYSQPPIAYQKFLELADTGQIWDATIYTGYNLAEIRASLREGSRSVRSDIPTAELAKLVKQMMDSGASVRFSTSRRFDLSTFLLDIAPFVIVAVLVIVQLRRKART